MRDEYDLSKMDVIRGKHAGKNIVIVGATGKARPAKNPKRRDTPALVVTIPDDLREHFPTADAVNEALRSLAAEMERNKPRGERQA